MIPVLRSACVVVVAFTLGALVARDGPAVLPAVAAFVLYVWLVGREEHP